MATYTYTWLDADIMTTFGYKTYFAVKGYLLALFPIMVYFLYYD